MTKEELACMVKDELRWWVGELPRKVESALVKALLKARKYPDSLGRGVSTAVRRWVPPGRLTDDIRHGLVQDLLPLLRRKKRES